MAETEVFRITPEVGKCYEHAEYTRSTGRWPNERYFVKTENLNNVGKFTHHIQTGYGDGAIHKSYFTDLNTGKTNEVEYSYAGRTSFREVPCQKGGLRKHRKQRKSKKQRKTKTRRH